MVMINLSKKFLTSFFVIMLFVIGVGYVLANWTPANHPVSHDSNDVKVNISGTDYSLQEAIDKNLIGSGVGTITQGVFDLNDFDSCNGASCYPNKDTADKICVDKGYTLSILYSQQSDCCGSCSSWDRVNNKWRTWKCGNPGIINGGDQVWINQVYCIK